MPSAELILVNGNIITMYPEQPKAQAVAIKHGRFAAVGTNQQILSHADEKSKNIDLKGKTVVPGFIDAHVHGASMGQILSQVNLRDAKSIKQIQRRVRQRATETPEGQWIIGRGWDQDRLTERRHPSRFDLDQAAPNHPVLLLRVCGHIGSINSEAMKKAGISQQTKPPKGGLIDRHPKTGEPNGVLRENALNLVFDVLPETTEEELEDTCLRACKIMVEKGITSAHWMISSSAELRALQRLDNRNLLPLRIYAVIPVEFLDNIVALGLSTRFGGEKIRIGSVKILADGSLGARTAALKKPYEDAPETKGMLLYSQDKLEMLVERAHKSDLQLAIHSIGDRTSEIVLKILEKVLEKTPKENHRHRLEHVSVLNQRLLDKLRRIKAIASVQPHFIVSDFWITDRLGTSRARWTYALRSLNEETIMIGGSDAPVEPVSPILGIYAAVARESFHEERLTVDEALRCYTINAAYGSFEEDIKGSIEKGKLADLIVLSRDPFKTAPEQIREIEVEMTIMGGTVVYAISQ